MKKREFNEDRDQNVECCWAKSFNREESENLSRGPYSLQWGPSLLSCRRFDRELCL
jgi:hypothetical protein